MKSLPVLPTIAALVALASLLAYFTMRGQDDADAAWPCAYPEFRNLLGQPSAEAFAADLPEGSGHLPGDIVPQRTDPTRLTIVHSGSLEAARTDPASQIVGLMCG